MWDSKNQMFYWSDMLAGQIWSYNPINQQIGLIAEGRNVSGFSMNQGGGFACACHQGLYLWDKNRGWKLIASEFEGQALHSNDATADAKGRFIFGTTFYDQTAGDNYVKGRLYSVATDGKITIIDEGWHLSNGIGFSPDNKVIYVTDTVPRAIYKYDYDLAAGTMKNKRIFVKIPDTDGIPDGMTVDAEGFVWSALWYGSAVVRFDPDGKEERRIHVPSGQTSSVMFGGPDFTDLYVTTAAEVVRLSAAPKGYDFDAPHNGSLYRFHPGIKGLPEHFANIRIPVSKNPGRTL
jgi:D-xylonolactonase